MWTNAKFPSKCAECKDFIEEGDRIVYEHHKAYCKECGIEVAGDDPLYVQKPEQGVTLNATQKRARASFDKLMSGYKSGKSF